MEVYKDSHPLFDWTRLEAENYDLNKPLHMGMLIATVRDFVQLARRNNLTRTGIPEPALQLFVRLVDSDRTWGCVQAYVPEFRQDKSVEHPENTPLAYLLTRTSIRERLPEIYFHESMTIEGRLELERQKNHLDYIAHGLRSTQGTHEETQRQDIIAQSLTQQWEGLTRAAATARAGGPTASSHQPRNPSIALRQSQLEGHRREPSTHSQRPELLVSRVASPLGPHSQSPQGLISPIGSPKPRQSQVAERLGSPGSPPQQGHRRADSKQSQMSAHSDAPQKQQDASSARQTSAAPPPAPKMKEYIHLSGQSIPSIARPPPHGSDDRREGLGASTHSRASSHHSVTGGQQSAFPHGPTGIGQQPQSPNGWKTIPTRMQYTPQQELISMFHQQTSELSKIANERAWREQQGIMDDSTVAALNRYEKNVKLDQQNVWGEKMPKRTFKSREEYIALLKGEIRKVESERRTTNQKGQVACDSYITYLQNAIANLNLGR